MARDVGDATGGIRHHLGARSQEQGQSSGRDEVEQRTSVWGQGAEPVAGRGVFEQKGSEGDPPHDVLEDHEGERSGGQLAPGNGQQPTKRKNHLGGQPDGNERVRPLQANGGEGVAEREQAVHDPQAGEQDPRARATDLEQVEKRIGKQQRPDGESEAGGGGQREEETVVTRAPGIQTLILRADARRLAVGLA